MDFDAVFIQRGAAQGGARTAPMAAWSGDGVDGRSMFLEENGRCELQENGALSTFSTKPRTEFPIEYLLDFISAHTREF